MDIYGARVSLTNSGNVPIRVYPENLRVHFGGETAGVYTINDYRFLRPTVLQPGESVSGLAGLSGVTFPEGAQTTAQELISFVMLIAALAELAFQIVALVWLYRNARNLPLTKT